MPFLVLSLLLPQSHMYTTRLNKISMVFCIKNRFFYLYNIFIYCIMFFYNILKKILYNFFLKNNYVSISRITCIYVAVAQKQSTVANIFNVIKSFNSFSLNKLLSYIN